MSRSVAMLLLGGLCVVLLSVPLRAQSPEKLRDLRPEEIARITEAMPAKAAVAPQKPRKILVFWRCETYFHTVIPVVNEALKIMGSKTGAFEVTKVTDDYSVFNAGTLKEFDAIVLNNTTTLKLDPNRTPEACKAIMDFVKGGKGLIGTHAAADCFYRTGNSPYDWPEAREMIGNRFTGHPWTSGSTVAIKLDEPNHPLMVPFGGKGFKIKDEIYLTQPPAYSREKQYVLMSVDTSDPNTRNVRGYREAYADTGITWIKDWGQGRVFYCSLGHNDEIFMTTPILEHYLRGIQFALGDLAAPAAPVRQAQAATTNLAYEIALSPGWSKADELAQGFDAGFRKTLPQGQFATLFLHHEVLPVEGGDLPADTTDIRQQWDAMLRNQYGDVQSVSAEPPKVGGRIVVNGTYELTDGGAKLRRRYTYFIAGRMAFVVQCSAPPSEWASVLGEFDAMLSSLKANAAAPQAAAKSDDAAVSELKRNLPVLLGSFPSSWSCSLADVTISAGSPQAPRTLEVGVAFDRSDVKDIYGAIKLVFSLVKSGKSEADLNTLVPSNVQASAMQGADFVKYVGQVWGCCWSYVSTCDPAIQRYKVSIAGPDKVKFGSVSISREDGSAILTGKVTAAEAQRITSMYEFE